MVDSQWQSILFRLYRSKEGAVGSFLKTDKLEHTKTFPIHPLPHTREFQYIRIGKIGFNGTGSINRFTDIAEQKHRSFLFLRQPTLGKARQSTGREFLLQTTPYALRLFFFGDYREDFIMK